MRPSGNTIFVTGGTGGIGLALAQQWLAHGNRVIVGGRDPAKLAKTHQTNPDLDTLLIDICDNGSVSHAAGELLDRFPDLNILVNNAGIMHFETVGDGAGSRLAEAMVRTNLLGPINLIDALAGHLSRQDGAAIINVTSGLAFVPLPKAPAYSASKAALHSYSVALRARLAGTIEVIEIAPPGVRTDLTPGQAENANYMLLDEFIEETMTLLVQQPTPQEILVERVRSLRTAEAEGRFAERLAFLAGR